ncbi:agamous-like MADS-box protein AGL62 [Abrus precatorius]|uniref:Agamous-like MADS-box protein AGL62 n=1 Tax=Abrus precatorius TaxID=3816 RepID=A0A8B8K0Q1_ABRPR|nr:agamous-like MADS-box protein AGL62 [Abrus precatorius]
MASNGATTSAKPKTIRRKIEIKKVEQKSRRHVTFSKRKLGLFNKLTELSILCHAETALIVTSQNGKLYSCGYPDADAVIRRYLTGASPQCGSKRKQQELTESLRLEYEASQNHLLEEKTRLQEIKEESEKNSFGFSSWWNHSIEDMSLDNLEQFKSSLEGLKLNLVAAVQNEKLAVVQNDKFNCEFPPLPLAVVPPPQLPNSLIQRLSEHQVHDYWNSGGDGIDYLPFKFPRSSFAHY